MIKPIVPISQVAPTKLDPYWEFLRKRMAAKAARLEETKKARASVVLNLTLPSTSQSPQ